MRDEIQNLDDFNLRLTRVVRSLSDEESLKYEASKEKMKWARHAFEIVLVILIVFFCMHIDDKDWAISMGSTLAGLACLASAFAMKPVFRNLQRKKDVRLLKKHLADSPSSPSGAPTSF